MAFSHLYPHLFQVGQAALIRNKQGKALIIQRIDGFWSLPEGALMIGETWHDSLAAALKHATGISEFKVKKILEVDNWEQYGETFYYTVIDCATPESQLAKLARSKRIYAWVNAREAIDFGFYHPKVRESLVRILSGVPHPRAIKY